MRSGRKGRGKPKRDEATRNRLGGEALGDGLDELARGKGHGVRQRRDAGEVAGHLAGLNGGQGSRFQARIDAEHALDPVYAHNLGVDVDNLYISQPDSGEDALEICDTLVRSGAIDIIVVDSVAALVPKAELEGDMGDSHVGLQARLMSQALRKLTGVISKTNTIIIFINQLREKVGVMFGNPETTTGGKALKFYASVRMDVRKQDTIKNGAEFIGNRTRVKIVKNKVAPPFKTAEFDMIYGEGISRESCILDMAVDQKIINKTGAWYSYNDMRMAQGRDNARLFLKDNKELCDEIEARVREKMMQVPAKTEEPEEEI